MACHHDPRMLPIEEALTRMRGALDTAPEPESVALDAALERVLAQAAVATLDVPGHDNSAMDGYALQSADSAGPLTLVGTAHAGHPFAGELAPGQCVRITTGAVVPAGADAVVMQENTQREGDTLTLTRPVRAGENIRRRGEDIAQGETLLEAGHRLRPVDIALLASLGMDCVSVHRRLRVAVFSTGDELTPPGQPLVPGQIYDSNRYAIKAVLQRLDAQVVDLGLIPDEPEAIRAALREADASADAVISSGGVSVGDADYVRDLLGELGEVNFWKVAIKPGKPFAFGRLPGSYFFGLPGNPVSAVVTLHQLALPVLQTLTGETPPPPLQIMAKAETDLKKRPGRADFQRARLHLSGGQNLVTPTGAQGSGVLTSLVRANGYVTLSAERETVGAGEAVTFVPFDRYLN